MRAHSPQDKLATHALYRCSQVATRHSSTQTHLDKGNHWGEWLHLESGLSLGVGRVLRQYIHQHRERLAAGEGGVGGRGGDRLGARVLPLEGCIPAASNGREEEEAAQWF